MLGIIPARYGSTRLEAKALAKIHEKPMIQWVWEGARRSRILSQSGNGVTVATDDVRIQAVVQSFGGRVVLTDPSIRSGTDRVAAVAKQEDADLYVNIQGDEPMMRGEVIDAALELVLSGRFSMATAMTTLKSREELINPNTVKVLADRNGRALYFSRYPIPYSRLAPQEACEPFVCKKHLGLYVFRKDTLSLFSSSPAWEGELGESLEQLRALYLGIPLGVAEVGFDSIGVDTAEDLEKVRKIL